MVKVGGGGAAGCTLIAEGHSLGKVEILGDFGWGVRGWAQLLSLTLRIKGETGCSEAEQRLHNLRLRSRYALLDS